VSLALLENVVSSVLVIFDFLGMPVEREGSVILLPRGRVGVAEACSGIRSMTGCIFAGSFLAAVFLNGFSRKVLLILASVGFAVIFNIVRSTLLTAWAYLYGPDALSGTVHDVTSFAVFGLTSLGLIAVLALFRHPEKYEIERQEQV
jgi:exosortase